ncbi:MAG: toll/interleukin-1 receptor domain-containing protein [Pseudomonadales bacterium]
MLDTPFPAYTGDEPYIFVSYAHADNEIIYPEIQWLRDQGFNVWYDEGISPGTVWRDELADSIEGSNLYLSNIANTRGPG